MTLNQILTKLKSLMYSKTETDTLLSNKAASSHTHTKSQITDFPTIPTKTSDLTNDNCIPLAGTNALGGSIVPDTDNTYNFGSSTKQFNTVYTSNVLNHRTNNELSLNNTNGGADIVLCPKEYNNGLFRIRAFDGTTRQSLIGYANGTLTWGSKNLAMQEDTIPRSGGDVITGLSLARNVDNSELQLSGATHYMNGASVILYGKDFARLNGMFRIRAALSDSSYSELCGWPSGVLTWYTGTTTKSVAMYEDVVPRSGGAVMTGSEFYRNTRDSYLLFGGGIHGNDGAAIMVCGSLYPYNAGGIQLGPRDGVIGNEMYLQPNGTWTWSGTAVQITSDQRLKQQIAEIDDKLLDAWEDVELVQFKYNDAVDQKGDNARLHTGYVVQQIDEVCKSHNLDISAYGLYCHEEYPEETEEVEVEQEDGTKIKERKVIREASEHYSLRYTETLVVECAFLRREVKRLSERLSKLEQPSTSEK